MTVELALTETPNSPPLAGAALWIGTGEAATAVGANAVRQSNATREMPMPDGSAPLLLKPARALWFNIV